MDLDVYAKQGSNGPGSLKLIRLYECMRDVLGVVAIHNWGGYVPHFHRILSATVRKPAVYRNTASASVSTMKLLHA
jgi:hypothetical protein